MNSKSKIWQIVLLALLVLAIVAILLFNNKLNASKQTLSNTMAQLTEEKQNSATLQADLDATKADYEQINEQLAQEKAKTVQLNIEVEGGKAAAPTANRRLFIGITCRPCCRSLRRRRRWRHACGCRKSRSASGSNP